jgi:integrase/recombinase XerD
MSSGLAQHLDNYLAMRRALGFKLRDYDHWLRQFVGYLDRISATAITVESALAWVTQPADAAPKWLAMRLTMIRGFARYMAGIDPATEVPSTQLLPDPRSRATPFIYSSSDVAALMRAARGCTNVPLTASTYRTLIGLLAVTGMRLGEAINLDRDDVDLNEGVLVVRQGKFGKSRELALHPSTVTALRDYAALRNRTRQPTRTTQASFFSSNGSPLSHSTVQHWFRRLTHTAGLMPRSATCRPRIHDLRHTFAVNTLLGWYRAGVDVQARLPLLSTYLGHVDPAHTYWYLTATPQLMQAVLQRLDRVRQTS